MAPPPMINNNQNQQQITNTYPNNSPPPTTAPPQGNANFSIPMAPSGPPPNNFGNGGNGKGTTPKGNGGKKGGKKGGKSFEMDPWGPNDMKGGKGMDMQMKGGKGDMKGGSKKN